MSDDPFDFTEPGEIRRTKDGRPYIRVPCPNADEITHILLPGNPLVTPVPLCVNGRSPGARGVRSKMCDKCHGAGFKEVAYTRCTTFVGVLDDRTAVEKWRSRVQLVGLALDYKINLGLADPPLIEQIDQWFDADFDDHATKSALNDIAERAFLIGDRAEKAQRGTNLHKLSEYVDAGQPLPAEMPTAAGDVRPVSTQDRADMAAWQRIKDERGLVFDSSECFVVNDRYKVAGTYDRRGKVTKGKLLCELCEFPNILDLKTGRVDFGAGKMAQQLAMYANSDEYNPVTGERTPQDVCLHAGGIIHLPQGSGEAQLYRVDLVAGYEDVHLSSLVRENRRVSKSRMEQW